MRLNKPLIKLAIVTKGYTITRLAEDAEIARGTLCKALYAKGGVSAWTAWKIAHELDIPPAEAVIVEEGEENPFIVPGGEKLMGVE